MKQKEKRKNRNVMIGVAILALLVIIGGGFAVVSAQAAAAEQAKLTQLQGLNTNLSYALDDAQRYSAALALSADSVSSTEGLKGVSADLDRIDAKINDAEKLIADGKSLIATMKPTEYTKKVSAAYAEYDAALKGYSDEITELRKLVGYAEKFDSAATDLEQLDSGMTRLQFENDPAQVKLDLDSQKQNVARIKIAIADAKQYISFGTEDDFIAYLDKYSNCLDAFGRLVDAAQSGDQTAELGAYNDVLSCAKDLSTPPSMDKYNQNLEKWLNGTVKPIAQQADDHFTIGDRRMEEAKQL